MIASNFTQEELSDLVIPKATVNFYAPDTNISMFPIDADLTTGSVLELTKQFHFK